MTTWRSGTVVGLLGVLATTATCSESGSSSDPAQAGTGGVDGAAGSGAGGGVGGDGGTGANGSAGAGGNTGGVVGVGGGGGASAEGGSGATGAVGGSGAGGGAGGSGGAPATTTTINPGGGIAPGPEGSSVEVPSGALTSPLAVTVAKAQSGYPTLPDQGAQLSGVFEITPHGTTFQQPVTVRLPYTAPPPGAELAILIAEPAGAWKLFPAVENVAQGVLELKVTHFSYFLTFSYFKCSAKFQSENDKLITNGIPNCDCYGAKGTAGTNPCIVNGSLQKSGCCPQDHMCTWNYLQGKYLFFGCCKSFGFQSQGWSCPVNFQKTIMAVDRYACIDMSVLDASSYDGKCADPVCLSGNCTPP